MVGLGSLKKKLKTPKICTSLKELGGILSNPKNVLLQIVVLGVENVGNQKANIWKNGGGWGDYNSREESEYRDTY